jgi:hypothetical protein
MNRTLHALLVTTPFVVGLLARAPEGRQTPARAPTNLSKLGPRVGERAPDFSLNDQHGKTWTRDSIAGPKGAMLVFFRSADW